MAGNKLVRDTMRRQTPRTYSAMTHLVVALAKAVKDSGKRTWLGNDKGVKAYAALMKRVHELVIAMTMDGSIRSSMSSSDAVDKIVSALEFFANAHPNWQDSYGLAYHMFVIEREDAIAMIERMR